MLVTGGAGYFGTVIVDRLLEQGVPVRILDVNRPDPVRSGVTVIQGDVRDLDLVRQACDGVDVVHHNVALVPLARDKEGFWTVNEGGTRNVMQAALDAGVRKVIHMSSSAIYGAPKANPVTEETAPHPGEQYGAAKLAAEAVCREFRPRGLDVTIVRPRTIMGHGRLGIMQILFEWIREGQPIPVFDGGRNRYQFVHGGDLADACLAAAERPGNTEYNVGAGEFGTMRETLEGLIAHAGSPSRIVSVPMAPAAAMMHTAGALGLSPLGPYHALMYGRSMWFDIGKAQRELNYQPRFSNVQMMRESYEWYTANREAILRRTGSSLHSMAVKQKALRLVPRILAMLPSVSAE